jgi:hypothetical protein
MGNNRLVEKLVWWYDVLTILPKQPFLSIGVGKHVFSKVSVGKSIQPHEYEDRLRGADLADAGQLCIIVFRDLLPLVN